MDQKEKDTLQQVSDATVQEPVSIEVDIKPTHFVHGKLQSWGILPKKRSFTLNPITMGSLVRISKLLLDIDLNVYDTKNIFESNYKSIIQHSQPLAEIVAIAIKNSKRKPSKASIDFIINNFTSKELLMVISIVLRQMDLTSFMSSIISVKGMNIMESRIANAGPAGEAEVSPSTQGS